ncbi:MAG: hypothetical protein EOO57_01995 [Hymenobacter sp.]|nr:MAG: hypothetical protein EOO57_01995 [Hymenobacter sp.]
MKNFLTGLLLLLGVLVTATPARAQRGHFRGGRGHHGRSGPRGYHHGPAYGPAYSPRYYHGAPYRNYGGRAYYRPRPYYRQPGPALIIRP